MVEKKNALSGFIAPTLYLTSFSPRGGVVRIPWELDIQIIPNYWKFDKFKFDTWAGYQTSKRETLEETVQILMPS